MVTQWLPERFLLCLFLSIFWMSPTRGDPLWRSPLFFMGIFFVMISTSAGLQLLAEATHTSRLEADWSLQRLLGCDTLSHRFKTEMAQQGGSPSYFSVPAAGFRFFSVFASLKILADKTLRRNPDPFCRSWIDSPEALAAGRFAWWRTSAFFGGGGGATNWPPP